MRCTVFAFWILFIAVSGSEGFQVNERIAASVAEGEDLLNEINSLLADTSVSSADKAMLNSELQSEVQDKKLRVASSFRVASLSRNAGASGISGVSCTKDCCKVVVPPETRQNQVRASHSCQNSYRQRYTTSCGFAGWNRCTRHRTAYRSGVCYREDIRYYHVSRPCPAEHKVCCEGHFYFRECCISTSRLKEIIQEIKNKIIAKQYVGCYNDAGDRDLPLYKELGGANQASACVDHCTTEGFKYAGLQYRTQCFCGSSNGKHGKANESDCAAVCPANNQQKCGGTWRNSIYRTSLAVDRYVGCYIDAANRDLAQFKDFGGANKAETCVNHCRTTGYKYAGLQYRTQCFCGHFYGLHRKANEGDCNAVCPGNSQEKCGGTWRNSIYRTDI